MGVATIYMLVSGFVFGLRHALDADHLAAVSVLMADSRQDFSKKPLSAVLRGIYWSIGHMLVLTVAGAAAFFIGLQIPESFSVFFEVLIGIVLIWLGAKYFYDFMLLQKPDGSARFISHNHFPVGSHIHPYKPFLVGMAHGLAGSAAILIVIAAAGGSAYAGFLYILAFGAGLTISMGAFSFVLAISAEKIRTKRPLAYFTSFFSISSGIWLIFSANWPF